METTAATILHERAAQIFRQAVDRWLHQSPGSPERVRIGGDAISQLTAVSDLMQHGKLEDDPRYGDVLRMRLIMVEAWNNDKEGWH